MRIGGSWLVAVSLCGAVCDLHALAAAEVDFIRQVRPVLSDNCFFCHGPDKQESGLRLDRAEVAIQRGAIVPRDAAASELFLRISSQDPDYRMPPPGANRELQPHEVQILRSWIEQGAVYKKHWAFRSVPELRLPEVADPEGWTRTPVDLFVLRQLQRQQLGPRPPADRARLLRRVTIDLTGLPPTIGEIDAFLADATVDAYERRVERLLAAPSFGEQMTQAWLDVARYADTFGYDNDGENRLWPWREWVIRAFNQNLRYSDFVRWQLAGDLLPAPSQDQLLATAFNRLHRQNAEGGVLTEEFLVEYVVDRTQTFGTAFLGLTIECSRCHDHKFDPVSQQDFYRLYALFGNIDEAGTYAEKTTATPTPNTFLYGDGQRAAHTALKKRIQDNERELEQLERAARARYREWRGGVDASSIGVPRPLVELAFETRKQLPESARLVRGRVGQAVRLTGDEGIRLEDAGAFERTSRFTIAAWLRAAESNQRMVVCHNTTPVWEGGQRGWELVIGGNGQLQFSFCHFWPGNALRVRTQSVLPTARWTHVAVTYDGSSRAEGLRIYLNGESVPLEVVRNNLYSTTRFQRQKLPPLIIGARLSELGFRHGEVDEFQLFDRCLTALELQRLVGPSAAASSDERLLAHYVQRVDQACGQVRQRLAEAREAESKFAAGLRSIMMMREKPRPATAHVLGRGAYDQPGERVAGGVPAAILDPGPTAPANRLELVDWMLRRDQPLVLRVAVNRIWKGFFGRGLVETLEDFGSQGALPTHPQLLDGLAAWFIDSGWDVKALCRMIVTSATYRQSSRLTRQLAARDPQNLLLARGPRRRLSAEEIRDAALTASGLLVRTLGGPSVKPTQPAGLWREVGPQKFVADEGENLYRRSLYTFWKRTVPPPTMMMFDAVSREVCVARRESTVTPGQALALLNDPQFVEAARALAVDVLTSYRDSEHAVEAAFRRLTGRRPRPAERRELLSALAEQRQIFAAMPTAAEEYLQQGAWRHEASLDSVDVASMTAVVQIVMSFFEFQVRS